MTKVNISTKVNCPLKTAWESYTDAKHIVNWNFANDDWHCPSAENDLRVGGKMKSRMEAKDGSFGFDFEAVYNEVQPLKRLVYTMGDGRKVEIEFMEENSTVTVAVSFETESVNDIELQRSGWQAILDNYARYTDSLK